MSELVVIDVNEIVPLDFFMSNGVETFLADVKLKVEAFKPDVSTKKGIDEVKSNAASIARAKTAIDNLGKDEVAKLKDLPKKIDAKRKLFRDTMDDLKEQVRKPVTEIEEAEKAAALAEEMKLQEAEAQRIAELEAREAEVKAKLEKLAQAEREEQIRKESAELAKQAHAHALKAAEDKAKADAEQALKDKEAAIQKVKDDAAKAEADRVAHEEAAKSMAAYKASVAAKEEAERVADVEHQKEVHAEASMSFQHCFTVEQSDKIIAMIASKQIKHVTITY